MGKTKAILVAVSEYWNNPIQLQLCKNDLYEMQKALVLGLSVNPKDILMCGTNGVVTKDDLIKSIDFFLANLSIDDILIFYFSGHGGKNCLELSDGIIETQVLTELIERSPIRCKIVILDSCYSGSTELTNIPQISMNETIEYFAGRGYAVMASCGSGETSGFNSERNMSLYTSFVCDALMARYLIRKGKKSLDSINEAILRIAEISNEKKNRTIQNPVFRSSIGGTIFFEVEEYIPYQSQTVYEETEEYIIYEVKPFHTINSKRLDVKVILRYPCSMEKIADLSKEIYQKVLYADVYSSERSEILHKGKVSNVLRCKFGYDEEDMVYGNFICYAVWIDETQNKNMWYRENENSMWLKDVYIMRCISYNALKILQNKDVMDKDAYIKTVRSCTLNLINSAECAINYFREFVNGVITETTLIDILQPINKEIHKSFLSQFNLPIPPIEIYDWSYMHSRLASDIRELILYYNKENLNRWTSETRKRLMFDAIKRYEETLDELKSLECNR